MRQAGNVTLLLTLLHNEEAFVTLFLLQWEQQAGTS